MNKNNFDLHDQLEDLEGIRAIRNVPVEQYRHRSHSSKHPTHKSAADNLIELAETENELIFSYSASKHEKEWLMGSLRFFYQQQWFDDILRLIKGGGKEASVYQCLANETTQTDYLAAKVYRPRKFRQLRNDSLYREGRGHLDDAGHEVLDHRTLHAIQQRTTYGMQMLHTSWIGHEFQTMSLLHKAGVSVPKPYVCGNNAILMAYIGWDDLPAPTLNTVNLTRQEAQVLFDEALRNIRIMLANSRVHGDLSAYNILYFEGEIYFIDFPQAIDPEENRNAYAIFKRDMICLCEYFQSQYIQCNPKELAKELWQEQGYLIDPVIDPRLMATDDSDG